MPLVRKRGREEPGEKEVQEEKCVKRAKTTRPTKYQEFSYLPYKKDHCYTLLRKMPEDLTLLNTLLSQQIGSFLNGSGGILCFGARESGVIYGESITRKEQDNIRLIIDDVIKRFHPIIKPQNYRVTFTPVESRADPSLFVVEIRVAQGEPGELYEDMFHQVFVRKNSDAYGPLRPYEIKAITIEQLRQKLRSQSAVPKTKGSTDRPRKEQMNEAQKLAMPVSNDTKLGAAAQKAGLSGTIAAKRAAQRSVVQEAIAVEKVKVIRREIMAATRERAQQEKAANGEKGPEKAATWEQKSSTGNNPQTGANKSAVGQGDGKVVRQSTLTTVPTSNENGVLGKKSTDVPTQEKGSVQKENAPKRAPTVVQRIRARAVVKRLATLDKNGEPGGQTQKSQAEENDSTQKENVPKRVTRASTVAQRSAVRAASKPARPAATKSVTTTARKPATKSVNEPVITIDDDTLIHAADEPVIIIESDDEPVTTAALKPATAADNAPTKLDDNPVMKTTANNPTTTAASKPLTTVANKLVMTWGSKPGTRTWKSQPGSQPWVSKAAALTSKLPRNPPVGASTVQPYAASSYAPRPLPPLPSYSSFSGTTQQYAYQREPTYNHPPSTHQAHTYRYPTYGYPPPAVSFPPSAVSYPPSAGSYPRPAGSYPLPAGSYPPPAVSYHSSHTYYGW